MKEHVFICYAREDEEFVLQLAHNLKSRGVPVWLDQWDISPGADWDQSIDNAIHDGATFLIVLSPIAVESTEVRGELRTALDEKKSIVSVVYQKCRIPRQLRTVQHIDFATSGPDDEAALERLVQTLGGKPPIPPVSEILESEVPVAPLAGLEQGKAEESIAEDKGKEAVRTQASQEQQAPVSEIPQSEVSVAPPAALEQGKAEESLAEDDRKEEAKTQAPQESKPQLSTVSLSSKAASFPRWVYGLATVSVAVIVLALIFRDGNPTEKLQAPEQPQRTPIMTEQPKRASQDPERKMVPIPAGNFWMGCNDKVDSQCGDDEKPGRTVYVDAFQIDTTEVTVKAYRRCVESGKCSSSRKNDQCNWDKQGRDDHPINCVTWDRARTYCDEQGKRLPTEAEWEKAARGEQGVTYPWGNAWEANKANTFESGKGGTVAVASYASGVSPYGVHDMAGNVWEWVQDWYAEDYYQHGLAQNPQEPAKGELRSVRGGSWLDGQRFARVANRLGVTPGDVYGRIGFRCASS